MQTHNVRRLASAAVCWILATGLAAAESSPEAVEWLEKLDGVYDQGPFKAHYTATFDMASLGMPVQGTLSADLLQGDRTHMRMEMAIELGGMAGAPGTADGQQTMKMTILSVNDGSLSWMEIAMPHGTQVMKSPLGGAAADDDGGLGFVANPTGMDPMGLIEKMTGMADFEVAELTADEVTLHGKLHESAQPNLGTADGAAGRDTLRLTLDRKTGFPKALEAGGEAPFLTLDLESFERLERGSLPPDAFEYTPPEGAQVMDLGAMQGTGGGP